MVFQLVNLKDNETAVEQVYLLIGIQQVVIFAAFVIWLKHVQETVNVKVLFTIPFFGKYPAVIAAHIFIEGVERRHNGFIGIHTVDEQRQCCGDGIFLATGCLLIAFLPEGQKERLDTLFLFDVKHPVFGIERIE